MDKNKIVLILVEHAETFFAQVEAETGSGLPDFVKDEFDAFLECGVLVHGFLRRFDSEILLKFICDLNSHGKENEDPKTRPPRITRIQHR